MDNKISTKEKVKTKREKISELFEKHAPLLKRAGVSSPKFIPKMAYPHEGELVIGFYPSEMNGEQDIYTEFVSRDYVPEDPERRLLKWMYNPEYDTEYKKTEPHPSTGDRRYLIPIGELIDMAIAYPKEEEQITEQTELFDLRGYADANSDQPYDQMSMRDYAAIQWKKPVSHKKWLNELITKQFE